MTIKCKVRGLENVNKDLFVSPKLVADLKSQDCITKQRKLKLPIANYNNVDIKLHARKLIRDASYARETMTAMNADCVGVSALDTETIISSKENDCSTTSHT